MNNSVTAAVVICQKFQWQCTRCKDA